MQKTELQIIFYLLLEKENVQQTVRQIALATGVSVGSVHRVLVELSELGYVVEEGKKRILRKRRSLIERWANAYGAFRKKNLFVARFTFLSSSIRANWRDIVLPGSFDWGGEPAVALQEGCISPQQWVVYTPNNANALIATARMIPSQQGEIFVYKRFWNSAETPLLIVYADLIASGDDRCREVAERIKNLI